MEVYIYFSEQNIEKTFQEEIVKQTLLKRVRPSGRDPLSTPTISKGTSSIAPYF